MPKMKTHRGAAKRIRRTGSGKLVRVKAYHSHILEKKSAKRKRKLGQSTLVSKQNTKAMNRLLGGK